MTNILLLPILCYCLKHVFRNLNNFKIYFRYNFERNDKLFPKDHFQTELLKILSPLPYYAQHKHNHHQNCKRMSDVGLTDGLG